MKRITCEMCGSTDLIKQDGVFVCQSCGCKYTMDEAKKLMVEGTDEVQGAVNSSASVELNNLYQIARRAKNDNNSENAAKYYDMILVKDPTSWEASFYVVYFRAMSCKIAQIRAAAISISNCEGSVLELIRDYVAAEEQGAAVKEVALRSTEIANMLAIGAKNHYDGISLNIRNKYTQEYIDNACAARDILYTCGSQIERVFEGVPEVAAIAAMAWKPGVTMHTELLSYFANQEANKTAILSYVEKIGKYDPAFAKDYIYKQKKTQLENDISRLSSTVSRLKDTVANTPTEAKWHWGGLSIFLLVCGIVMLILGQSLKQMGASEAWVYPVGILELLLACLCAAPKKAQLEARRKIVEEAQAELVKKEEELAEKTEELEALKL